MNRDLVHKVPVFQLMSAEVYIRMVQRMVQVTFLPGEYIIRQGEEGHHMYFILRGRVDGLLSNEVTVFATFMVSVICHVHNSSHSMFVAW